jgi:dihydrofolate reductase
VALLEEFLTSVNTSQKGQRPPAQFYSSAMWRGLGLPPSLTSAPISPHIRCCSALMSTLEAILPFGIACTACLLTTPLRAFDVIRLIGALDLRRGIATASGIPWKLPGDTAYFHEKTTTGLILMGWATYNEFAAPLHDRDNFVLTDGPGPLRTGFRAIGSLDELGIEHPGEDIWVLGGAAVYAETINEADELLLTQVEGDFNCTKFFPPYQSDFRLAAQSDDRQDGEVKYRFETWQRLAPKPKGSG